MRLAAPIETATLRGWAKRTPFLGEGWRGLTDARMSQSGRARAVGASSLRAASLESALIVGYVHRHPRGCQERDRRAAGASRHRGVRHGR